jgi:Uma2 family endonuclease
MTATAPPPNPPPAETPEVFYGWRFVQHDLPDGNVVFDQVPLTLEDVLHPEEGDQVTHSDAHQRRCIYLYNVLRSRLADDRHAVVLNDVRIKWDTPELRPHGPDLMVIFNVRERKNWSTFDVAQEGTRPALIIEITSPETRGIDLIDKLDHYDIASVPLYVIVDAVERRGREMIRLMGHRQTETAYATLAPDERGWLWLEPVQLWLGVRDNEVYFFDADGVQMGDYVEVNAALVAAEERAALAEERATTEAHARAVAEARIHELEAELRRLRGEA